MNREIHVRLCERLGAKFPGPTRRRRGDPSPYADLHAAKSQIILCNEIYLCSAEREADFLACGGLEGEAPVA